MERGRPELAHSPKMRVLAVPSNRADESNLVGWRCVRRLLPSFIATSTSSPASCGTGGARRRGAADLLARGHEGGRLARARGGAGQWPVEEKDKVSGTEDGRWAPLMATVNDVKWSSYSSLFILATKQKARFNPFH